MPNTLNGLLCGCTLGMIPFLFPSVALADDIIRFQLQNNSKNFKIIDVLEEKSNGTLVPLLSSDDIFTASFPKSTKFYDSRTFRIKIDKKSNWPLDLSHIDLDISILIRKDEPFDLTIPIDIPDADDDTAMKALEIDHNSFDMPSKLVTGGILFKHFQIQPGDGYDITAPAARIWYDAWTELAAKNGIHFQLNSDLKEAVEVNLESNAKAKRDIGLELDKATTRIFGDINEKYDGLLAKGQCDLAINMIDDLIDLAILTPDDLRKSRITMKDLTDRRDAIPQRCKQPGSAARGPSFDCRSSTLPAETTICGDAALFDLDVQLQHQFLQLLGTKPVASVRAIRDDELKWLRDRNACATDKQCIGDRYQEQLRQLKVTSQSH